MRWSNAEDSTVLVHQVLWADWVLADGQYFTRWVHLML